MPLTIRRAAADEDEIADHRNPVRPPRGRPARRAGCLDLCTTASGFPKCFAGKGSLISLCVMRFGSLECPAELAASAVSRRVCSEDPYGQLGIGTLRSSLTAVHSLLRGDTLVGFIDARVGRSSICRDVVDFYCRTYFIGSGRRIEGAV